MITGNGTGVGGVVNDGSCSEEDRNCQDSDEPSAHTQLVLRTRDEHRAYFGVSFLGTE